MNLKKTYHKIVPQSYRIKFRNQRDKAKDIILRSFYLSYDKNFRQNYQRLNKFKDTYQNSRCFIMGNGPSLNRMDLSLFQNEYVWGSNLCYLLFDQIKWRPKFFVAVDTRVVPDNANEINKLSSLLPQSFLFFPTFFRYQRIINSSKNIFWFEEKELNESNLPYSMFSLDPSKYLYSVRTVTITALQLAVYFGFNPIYLIGCDTNYKVPNSVIYESNDKYQLISTSDDENHFHVNYFGKGKKWHEPHVDQMIYHYEQAKKVCDDKHVKIFNATLEGKLEVFPRVNYLDLFK